MHITVAAAEAYPTSLGAALLDGVILHGTSKQSPGATSTSPHYTTQHVAFEVYLWFLRHDLTSIGNSSAMSRCELVTKRAVCGNGGPTLVAWYRPAA